MNKYTFSKAYFGKLSIIFGSLSFLLFFFIFPFPIVFYIIGITSVIGITFGVLGVNTKFGAFGMVMNILAGLIVLSIQLGIRHLFNT